MSEDRRFLRTVEQIYEAATDPARLTKLVSMIAPAFDCGSSLLFMVDKRTLDPAVLPKLEAVPSATDDFDAWAGAAYNGYYYDRNEWFSRGIRRPIPAIVIGQELIDDRSFERTEFYNDWCRKIDAFHVLGCSFPVDGNTIGAIGFHRPRHAPQFDEGNRRMMTLLMPHLQRALQIHYRLDAAERQNGLTLEILDRMTTGALVVGDNCRLLFANRVAERVLKAGTGIAVSQGRLWAQDVRNRLELEKIVSRAISTSAGRAGGAGSILSLPRPSGRPLALLISPLLAEHSGFGSGLPAALVMFSDPDSAAAASEDVLAQSYGLTPSEARLLSALLSGSSLTDYAAAIGISINTAKRHLDHIFNKTGHHRQVDLIRSILGDSAIRLSSRGNNVST